jgi:hypothetical protein
MNKIFFPNHSKKKKKLHVFKSKGNLPFYYFSKINVNHMEVWDLAKKRGINNSPHLFIISYFCRICKVSRPALSITVHRHFFLHEWWVCSHCSAFYWKMHFPWVGPRGKDLPELWQHYRYEKLHKILSGRLNCFGQGWQKMSGMREWSEQASRHSDPSYVTCDCPLNTCEMGVIPNSQGC